MGVNMKLEIEVTEEQIRSGIERNLRIIIANYNTNCDDYVRRRTKELWTKSVDDTINEILNSKEHLSKLIDDQIKRTIDKRMKKILNS
jgi:hypothetical protein